MSITTLNLTKEECEIIWDALCEVTEDTNTVWRDRDMPKKISALADRFNKTIHEMEQNELE
jgi:hypothetical protein